MPDVRVKTSGRVAMVAHCLLNQNTKPYMRARFPGIVDPVLDVLREEGYALFQLPCPEVGHAGLSRFSQVIEQYDTPRYRAHCRDLAVRVVDQIDHYRDYGYSLVMLGIDGSPSCGITKTWSARIEDNKYKNRQVPGTGVLAELLKRNGIKIIPEKDL